MGRLCIDDAELEYSEIGRGEPLLLVHGSASDCRTWRFQRLAFADRFRVICFSRRYHWPNSPIPEGADYSMLEQTADLGSVIRGLGAAPAHLVGHSYGAFLCLLLAMKQRSLVRTLVLAEPPVITLFVSPGPTPWEFAKLLLTRPRTAAAIMRFAAMGVGPARRAFQRGDLEAGIRAFGDAVLGPAGYEHLPESLKAEIHDNLPTVRAELLGSGLVPLAADALQTLDLPTLLVTGEKSVALFHRLADRLGELLPAAERVEIRGGTHMMHQDNASAFNRSVRRFLDIHGEAGPGRAAPSSMVKSPVLASTAHGQDVRSAGSSL